MKKIYLKPTVETVSINLQRTILDGSLPKNDGVTVSGGSGGWTKQNNGWDDIWDSGDEDVTDEKW